MNTNPIHSTHWQLAPNLNEQAVQGIDDIHQCIANILNTLPNMVREITLALQRWENRIEVESVQISGQAPHFELLIFWTLVDDVYREIYQTSVQIGGTK